MSKFRMFFFLVDSELVFVTLSFISFAHRGLCTKAVTPVNTNEKTGTKSINSTKLETESKSEVLVPTGSDFAELRRSKAFVDKTDFIHDWLLYQPDRLGIVAPPGSGKSSLLSMVRHFCNASTAVHNSRLIYRPYTGDLFEGTMITILKDFHNLHRRKYTVINVEFAPLRRATDRGSFERLFCAAMRGMVDDYRFLTGVKGLNETERKILQVHDDDCLRDFESAVRQYGPRLVGVLQKYLKNDVIVLVDDIDAVLDVFATQDDAESFSDFAISTVGGFVSAFVANESQAPIASRLLAMSSFEFGLILPGLLNHTVTSMEFDRTSVLGDYFGLTKPEVDKLLAKYSLQDHSRMVTYLYDGHTIFESPSVSNTRAVLKYIQDHHRGISPTTETPNAILRDYENMFRDEWVRSAVTSCVFDGISEEEYSIRVRYENILQLRQDVKKANQSKTNVQLLSFPEGREIFRRLLSRLGLVQIFEDLCWSDYYYDEQIYHSFAPTSNFNAAVLRDYFILHNTENLFEVRARNKIAIVDALKNLAPTSASIEKLKDAIHGIVQKKDPKEGNNLRALVYTLARKTADYYGENLVVDTGVVAYSTDEKNAMKSKGTPVKYGKREVLLVQKERNLGVVIVSRYSDTDNATSLLNEVTNKTYTDVFDTIPIFSKYNLKERMTIAVIVSGKAVDVYGEVHGSNGSVVRRMHHTSSRL